MDMLAIVAAIGVFAVLGFMFYRAFRSDPNKDTGELPGKPE